MKTDEKTPPGGNQEKGSDMAGDISLCPVTGLPVLSRAGWRHVKLDEGYHASFFLLGDSVLVGRPSGYGTMKGVKKLLKVTEEIVKEFFPPGIRYIRIVDCTDYKGMSLKARKFFSDEMKKRTQTRYMIFCGVSTFFSLGVQLANRLHRLPYELKIVDSYGDAARLAMKVASVPAFERNLEAEEPGGAVRDRVARVGSHGGKVASLESGTTGQSREASVTEEYVADLLSFLECMKWGKSGVTPEPEVRPDHPFMPVFRSITLIKRDLDTLFNEHRKTVEALKSTHEGLWERVAERTAELSARNASLKESLAIRDKLFDALSVELNRVLGARQNNAGDGAMRGQEEKAKGALAVTSEETHRLNSLFRFLKALNDLEAGRVEPRQEVFDLASLVGDVRVRYSTGAGMLCDSFSGRLSEGVRVKGDPDLVARALGILAESLLESGVEGAREVDVSATQTHGQVRFHVGSSGGEKGFSRPFLPFQGSPRRDSPKAGRVDAGLYVAWKAASLLRGALTESGEEGIHAEYVFSLPLQP